jgi:hypothetical protein
MYSDNIVSNFDRIHGEFLDELAAGNPDAIVSVLTFDLNPYVVYLGEPISDAPVLNLKEEISRETGGWEDLPKAIHLLLRDVVNRDEYAGYKPAVIIITDGATDGQPTDGRYIADAKRDIKQMRDAGASILLLMAFVGIDCILEADDLWMRPYAESRAAVVGVLPSEIRFWGQAESAFKQALTEVSSEFALGAAGTSSSVQSDETDGLIALPSHGHGRSA